MSKRPKGLKYKITKVNRAWFKPGSTINVGRKRPDLIGHPRWGMKKGQVSALRGRNRPNLQGPNHYNWKGGKANTRMLWRKRRVLEANAEGSHTLADWETLKAQYNWKCPCCKRLEPEIKLTEDHIIPLTKGGSHNIENIQPLCGSCNSKKRTRIIKFEL